MMPDTLAPNHPEVAFSSSILGYLYCAQGNREKAIEFHRKAVDAYMEVYKTSDDVRAVFEVFRSVGDVAFTFGVFEDHKRATEWLGMQERFVEVAFPGVDIREVRIVTMGERAVLLRVLGMEKMARELDKKIAELKSQER
jgi:hypothetical protein